METSSNVVSMDHIMGIKLVVPVPGGAGIYRDQSGAILHGGWQEHPDPDGSFIVPVLGGLFDTAPADMGRAVLVGLECDERTGENSAPAGCDRFRRVRVRLYKPDEITDRPVLAAEVLEWAAGAGQAELVRALVLFGGASILPAMRAAVRSAQPGTWSLAAYLADHVPAVDQKPQRMPVELDRDSLRVVRRHLRATGRTFQGYALVALHDMLRQRLHDEDLLAYADTGNRKQTSLTLRIPWDMWKRVLSFLAELESRTGWRASFRLAVRRAVIHGAQ